MTLKLDPASNGPDNYQNNTNANNNYNDSDIRLTGKSPFHVQS